MPNATTPAGLVTNEIGWRGPPLKRRKPDTVRIVFIGASTTAEAHETPWSYPELVGHWLELWAAARGLDLDIQALNAGREGTISTDTAAVVRNEVVPMHPDLVVYYEGANQFDLSSIARGANGNLRGRTTVPVEQPSWLATFARYSSIGVRLRSAVTLMGDRGNGREPEKPAYTIEWPAGLDEADPDLGSPSLPVNLGTILHDLDSMRADLHGVGAELAVSSFVWLVHDGMVVDPLRGRYIWQQLNRPGPGAIATWSNSPPSRTGCSRNTPRSTACPSSTSRATCRRIPACSPMPSTPPRPVFGSAPGSCSRARAHPGEPAEARRLAHRLDRRAVADLRAAHRGSRLPKW